MRENLHHLRLRNPRRENTRLLRPVFGDVENVSTRSAVQLDRGVQWRTFANRNGTSIFGTERAILAARERWSEGHRRVSGGIKNRGVGLRYAAVLGRVRSLPSRRMAQEIGRGSAEVWSGYVLAIRHARSSRSPSNHGVLYSSKSFERISAGSHRQNLSVFDGTWRASAMASAARQKHSRQARHLGWRVWSGTMETSRELPLARHSGKFADAI